MPKAIAATAAVTAALAAAVTASGAGAAEKWDMPVAYPATNFHTENAVAFAKCVGEKSNGALEIVVHPNGSLFSGSDIKRAVQTGQAPIGERVLSAHENENRLFGIDAIPFLATSYEASDKLWNAAQGPIKEALAKQKLTYLYSVPWPPQGLYTKKDINSAADLKGLKFRAYNAATSRLAELAGMIPVQIEAAELSQALATGVAEAMITSGSTGVDSKVWESVDHFYDVSAWLPRNVVFANADAMAGLDEASRGALSACAEEARSRGTARSQELATEYLKTLAEHGMKVSPPGEQLKADLEGFGATMTQDFVGAAGDQGKAIIDAYRGQ